MNLIGQIAWRLFIGLLILWAALGMVTVAALIKYTFWREEKMKVWSVTECPACGGTGVNSDQEDICGLCDGETALVLEIGDE